MRTAQPSTQAGSGHPAAAASSARTTAQAPSDDGEEWRSRIGSHNIREAAIASSVMSVRRTCAYGFNRAFWRSFSAARSPMCAGAPERWMYSRHIAPKRLPVPPCQRASNGSRWSVEGPPLPSDCFSNATTSTRAWTPAETRLTPVLAATPPAFPDV